MKDSAIWGPPAGFEPTRKQRTALASCWWRPCPTCKANVPLARGVGCAVAGFDALHGPACRSPSQAQAPESSRGSRPAKASPRRASKAAA